MTSCIRQTVEEIVTEISMSSQQKPWLIVEGNSDGVFFSTKKLHNNPTTIVACGWENVVGVISKVIDESIVASVFGFIDRDYREDLGISVNTSFVVITDLRDLEISMFESSALDRILVELGSRNKLPLLPCGSNDIESVKLKVYSVASKIGKLRYYSLKHNLGYPIKKLDFTKFIDSKNLDIDKKKLIQQVNSKSESKLDHETLEKAFNSELPNRLIDSRNLCSGHDVIELLGISLRKIWGTNNSGDVSREKLESCFRIGYSDNEFEETEMFNKLDSLLKSKV